MPDARALFDIARWRNAIIAALAVYVGAWWSARDVTRSATLYSAVAAIALTGYANAFNDLTDIAIDCTAHPDRPLPRGAVTARDVRRFAALLAAAGIAFSFAARPSLGILSVAVVALMTLYSTTLARVALVGNVCVAVLASFPFFYGAVTVGAARDGIALLAVAAPLHFARELAKSIDDAPADAPYRRTAPIVFGRGVTVALIAIAVGLFSWRVFALPFPDPDRRMYVIPAIVIAVVATRRALARRTGSPLLFKTAMLAAMAAIVLAR